MNNIEKIRGVLRTFGRGVLNPRRLTDRIAKKANMPEAEVVLALQELARIGEVQSQAWDTTGRPVAKLYLSLPPEPLKAHEIQWEEALETALGEHLVKDLDTLRPCVTTLKDMPKQDMVKLIYGLVHLRQDMLESPEHFKGRRQFDVSAEYLLGSSKLIKTLPNRVLTAFGIDIDALIGAPRYVIVAGASEPKATILIENPHSFEAAVLADQDEQYCWIATYGYGLSKTGENYGDQLIDLVSEQELVTTLSRRGPIISIGQALERGMDSLFFWGDLDLSGMDIYCRLKKQLPTLSLSALYQPMIDELAQGGGHYYLSVQKERQTIGTSPFSVEIAPLSSLCSVRGVDQEIVSFPVNPEVPALRLDQFNLETGN